MVCEPCTRGEHCGQPKERTPQCTCQHRNPGAWRGVKEDEES